MDGYLSSRNFLQALALGAVVTAMSYPRIESAHLDSPVFLGTTLLGMVLVAGAATAWGRSAELPGVLPEPRRLGLGLLGGLLLGAAAVPFYRWVDPPLREALADPGHARALALAFPPTLRDRVAAILWGAGLETLLFQAGAVSFFARLTGNRSVAVAASALLRGFVAYRQATTLGLMIPAVVEGQMLRAMVAGALYAGGGLPGAAVFAALVDARHLLGA